ncbi:hypothetical protein PR048_024958 [Dryococelus australis]|uniref:Uncharacterized protein n=1 Tax=Dryococelus australis TaxID=614101 RepID=A0ABQ9GQ33_9NEOP|nr:hypothetical protein PR048_024958 [Dryococelus australis]
MELWGLGFKAHALAHKPHIWVVYRVPPLECGELETLFEYLVILACFTKPPYPGYPGAQQLQHESRWTPRGASGLNHTKLTSIRNIGHYANKCPLSVLSYGFEHRLPVLTGRLDKIHVVNETLAAIPRRYTAGTNKRGATSTRQLEQLQNTQPAIVSTWPVFRVIRRVVAVTQDSSRTVAPPFTCDPPSTAPEFHNRRTLDSAACVGDVNVKGISQQKINNFISAPNAEACLFFVKPGERQHMHYCIIPRGRKEKKGIIDLANSTMAPRAFGAARATFMEQRWNGRAGETGDLRENTPTSGIVRHDSHMRKYVSGSKGNRTRFAKVEGEFRDGAGCGNYGLLDRRMCVRARVCVEYCDVSAERKRESTVGLNVSATARSLERGQSAHRNRNGERTGHARRQQRAMLWRRLAAEVFSAYWGEVSWSTAECSGGGNESAPRTHIHLPTATPAVFNLRKTGGPHAEKASGSSSWWVVSSCDVASRHLGSELCQQRHLTAPNLATVSAISPVLQSKRETDYIMTGPCRYRRTYNMDVTGCGSETRAVSAQVECEGSVPLTQEARRRQTCGTELQTHSIIKGSENLVGNSISNVTDWIESANERMRPKEPNLLGGLSVVKDIKVNFHVGSMESTVVVWSFLGLSRFLPRLHSAASPPQSQTFFRLAGATVLSVRRVWQPARITIITGLAIEYRDSPKVVQFARRERQECSTHWLYTRKTGTPYNGSTDDGLTDGQLTEATDGFGSNRGWMIFLEPAVATLNRARTANTGRFPRGSESGARESRTSADDGKKKRGIAANCDFGCVTSRGNTPPERLPAGLKSSRASQRTELGDY